MYQRRGGKWQFFFSFFGASGKIIKKKSNWHTIQVYFLERMTILATLSATGIIHVENASATQDRRIIMTNYLC